MKKIWKLKLIDTTLSLHAGLSRIDKNKAPLSSYQDFSRIVIFSTTALGDLLFNTPAIKAIKRRFPAAKIMLVSSIKNLDLIKGSEWFDEVITWDNKIANAYRVIKAMRKFKPDLTVLLHSKLGYDILCARLAGSKYIIRDNFSSDNIILNHWLDYYSPLTDEHIIQRKLNLVSVLGCDDLDSRMQFPNTVNSRPQKRDHPVIGFQMGASGKDRCWPVDHFAQLAERLFVQTPNAKIVLTGAPQDLVLEQAFFEYLPMEYHSSVTSYIGKTRLTELVQLIENIDVLITGDTGPLHIAITAETPTVSLYVSANPRHTGPYQDLHQHQTIRITPETNDDPVYPLRKISVEQVYNAMRKNLS